MGTSPRIIGLSMVKNEGDIIEPFIRHNARYLDFMVILDNASVDDTRQIALKCARELKTVVVTDSSEFGYTQSERMTQLLLYSQSAYFADFVLLLDADEFISTPDRQTFELSLSSIPQGGVGLIPWRTFVLTPADMGGSSEDPPRSLRHRRNIEYPLYRKAVLRLDGVYRQDLHVNQGNHGIASGRPRLAKVILDDLPLLHFPVRSREQLVCKSVVGWMAYSAKNPAARRDFDGLHWRDYFDRVTAGRSALSDTDLCQISVRYHGNTRPVDWQRDVVEDNPPFDYVRAYSTGEFAGPVSLIARSWERSLVPPDPLTEFTRPPSETEEYPSAAEAASDAACHWGNLYVDVAPFRYIAEKYCPSSVLDIGCGVGAYLTLFKRLGAEVIFGVDEIPANVPMLEEGEYAVQDLGRPLQLDRAFDFVICVDVAERLEARSAELLLDTIARHANQTIVYSAAEPGQPGDGHINCRPMSYWLAQWARRGWFPDLADSLAMRCLATLCGFRRNFIVLRRGEVAEGSEATAVLCEISERPFTWYEQPPGIRSEAFSESLPPPPAGYARTA